jgi:hypothetical protein
LYLWKKGAFVQAFSLIAESLIGLESFNIVELSSIKAIHSKTSPKRYSFCPYLLHSRNESNDQEAADIFEDMVSREYDFEEWDEIENSIDLIYSTAIILNTHVKDRYGKIYDGFEYWNRAKSRAEQNASPLKNLKGLIGDNLWQKLEKETRNHLIRAEKNWEQNAYGDMLRDYRFALEYEMPKVFTLYITNDFLERLKKDTEIGQESRLAITMLKKELTNVRNGFYLDNINRKASDHERLLVDLTNFIDILLQYRVKSEHVFLNEDIDKNKAEFIRSKLIGIDYPSDKAIFALMASLK